MIAIIDYGMGNLRSVQKAFEFLGFDARITDGKEDLKAASHIVLPGVGAMAEALFELDGKNIIGEMLRQIESGKPFLGICLGMQMLLDISCENGEHNCLGLIKGRVEAFPADGGLKVPHMGWNSITINDDPLFTGVADGAYMYFVHSYRAVGVPEENVPAVCGYLGPFACAVRKDNITGVQFHPEKSGDVGLRILKNFGGTQ